MFDRLHNDDFVDNSWDSHKRCNYRYFNSLHNNQHFQRYRHVTFVVVRIFSNNYYVDFDSNKDASWDKQHFKQRTVR